MLSVALIGECMIEMSASRSQGQVSQGFAGDTLNTAVYLRRLISPARARLSYVTALGIDNFSQAMVDNWDQQGIDTALVRRLPSKLPGLYYIQVDGQGERTFSYWRGDSAAKRCFDGEGADQLIETLSSFDYLYLSGISAAILTGEGRARLLELLVQASQKGAQILFDNNYRPTLWKDEEEAREVYQAIYQYADIALLTLEDEQALFAYPDEQALLNDSKYDKIPELVLKRGAQPCLIRVNDEIAEVSGTQVERVVDTTAAGDSFSAGYVACRLQGGDPSAAAEWGHLLAGTVIQHHGAIIDESDMPLVWRKPEEER